MSSMLSLNRDIFHYAVRRVHRHQLNCFKPFLNQLNLTTSYRRLWDYNALHNTNLSFGPPPASMSSVTFVWPSCSRDLDLDPITLMYEHNIDILKMYPHTKNEVSRSRPSKVRAWTGQTDRHTDRRDRTHYHATLAGVIVMVIFKY